jgi:hypothetical protein
MSLYVSRETISSFLQGHIASQGQIEGQIEILCVPANMAINKAKVTFRDRRTVFSILIDI